MIERVDECIPVEDLVEGALYVVLARNFHIGMWDGKRCFLGQRHKFGQVFIDKEIHWDLDDRHGTAQPIHKLELYEQAKEIQTQVIKARLDRINGK